MYQNQQFQSLAEMKIFKSCREFLTGSGWHMLQGFKPQAEVSRRDPMLMARLVDSRFFGNRRPYAPIFEFCCFTNRYAMMNAGTTMQSID